MRARVRGVNPHPGFKSGTFYFAEKRKFLFCVDIFSGSFRVRPTICEPSEAWSKTTLVFPQAQTISARTGRPARVENLLARYCPQK
jgi:hypothetical protein